MMPKRRLAFIFAGVPNRFSGGSSYSCYTIIKQLVSCGWDITLISVFTSHSKILPEIKMNEYTKELVDLGIKCIKVETKEKVNIKKFAILNIYKFLKKVVFPAYSDYDREFYSEEIAQSLKPILKNDNFDCAFAFDNTMAVSLGKLDFRPKFVILGDPYSHVEKARILKEPFSLSKGYILRLLFVIYLRKYTEWIAFWAERFDACASYAFHEAKMYNKMGLKSCFHQKVPLEDLAGIDVLKLKPKISKKPVKIILIGQIQSNFAGIRDLGNVILPELMKYGLTSEIQINIIGNIIDNIPSDIKEILSNPVFNVKGFVEKIEDELLSADIVLVPTPHPVGVRSKIITAFCFACAVVTDSSSLLGLPELNDGVNALIGKDGQELALHLKTLIKDRQFMIKLQENGRKTYEENFSPEIACKTIENKLIEIISK